MLLLQTNYTDSILISKLEVISKAVTEIQNKHSDNDASIMVAIITGGLLLFGQYWDRKSKEKQKLNSQLLAAYYECENELFQLKTLFVKLASDRNLTELSWSYYNVADSLEPRDEKDVNKYYEDSTESSKNALNGVPKIGRKFSEYYSSIMKFSILAKMDVMVKEFANAVDDVNIDGFDKAEVIKEDDYDKCLAKYEHNKTELIKKYLQRLNYFEQLNRRFHAYTFTKLKTN